MEECTIEKMKGKITLLSEHSPEQTDGKEPLSYDGAENDPGQDLLGERALSYAWKRQGDYTLEDYYALPDEQRVELIDGAFYDMAAPTISHQIAVLQIASQLNHFIDSQGGSCLAIPSPVDVQLDCDERTMVQPDVVVVCDWNKVINRCVYGAPDLVMEVLSPSTENRDQKVKMEKYQKAGVREYWMIHIERQKVVVYDFVNNRGPMIYGINQPIPVQIYDGKCRISFEEIYAKVNRVRKSQSVSRIGD